jgi:hypothetical protein
MILKCMAMLIAGLMLTGCCGFGNGCAPVASAPASDGLDAVPTGDLQPIELRPKQLARARRENAASPFDTAAREKNGNVDQWERQRAADQAEEVKLKRMLMICGTC